MDQRTARLLTELADKLGTTTEYLWGVLVKQAPIDFFATTIQYFLLLGLFYTTYRLWRFCIKNEFNSPGIMISAAILTIISILGFFMGFNALPTYLASVFNPEYWALKQILK